MKFKNKDDNLFNYKIIFGIIILLFTTGLILNCANRIERITTTPTDLKALQSTSDLPYLKLHMKNGYVYSLENWEYSENKKLFTGEGKLLDFNRQLVKKDSFSISAEDIVLAETNRITSSAAVMSYTLLTAMSLGFTIYCATNPKACFGSCPTFYVFNGNEFVLEAEGFSSSVTPSLEAIDIDAISKSKLPDNHLLVKVTNEAIETHVIRKANILAVPHQIENTIYSTPENKFWEVSRFQKPDKCSIRKEDYLCEVSAYDGLEWFSSADSSNLAEKEILEIVFTNSIAGEYGLVVAYRQTLLTTFLFYQTLAYMGKDAGFWISRMERNNTFTKNKIKHVGSLLGDIEVLIKNKSGDWNLVGTIGETGPITTDVKLVQLAIADCSDSLIIGLRMTKGLWRIDHIQLVTLVKEVEPIRIEPKQVYYAGKEDSELLKKLTNEKQFLISLPGDAFQIYYELPDNFNDFNYFIESQGYYLEWIREEWITEENPLRIQQMLFNPKNYLKDLAPQFKKIEAEMEESFWRSRYVIP